MLQPKQILQIKNNEISYSLIVKYCKGEANKIESREIEEQMTCDPFLADAVEGYFNINDWNKIEKINTTMLHHHANIQYADQEQQPWQPEDQPNDNPKKSKTKLWLSLAASVLVLVGAGFLLSKTLFKKGDKDNVVALDSKVDAVQNASTAEATTDTKVNSQSSTTAASVTQSSNYQIATTGESLFDFDRFLNNSKMQAKADAGSVNEVKADARSQDEIVGSKNEALAMLEKQANENLTITEVKTMENSNKNAKDKNEKKYSSDAESLESGTKNASTVAAVAVPAKPVAIKPKMADAQVQSIIYQANEMINNGQTQKALDALSKVLADYPNHPEANLQVLKAQLKNANPEAAFKAIRKVNRSGVQYEDLRWQTAKLMSKKNHPKAFVLLGEIIDKKSNKYYNEAYKLTKFHNPDNEGDAVESEKSTTP